MPCLRFGEIQSDVLSTLGKDSLMAPVRLSSGEEVLAVTKVEENGQSIVELTVDSRTRKLEAPPTSDPAKVDLDEPVKNKANGSTGAGVIYGPGSNGVSTGKLNGSAGADESAIKALDEVVSRDRAAGRGVVGIGAALIACALLLSCGSRAMAGDEPAAIEVKVLPGSMFEVTRAGQQSPQKIYRAAEALRKLYPGCGHCLRCGIPWDLVGHHDTEYKLVPAPEPIPVHPAGAVAWMGNTAGCFPLCVQCFNRLKASDRLCYYRKLFERNKADYEKLMENPPPSPDGKPFVLVYESNYGEDQWAAIKAAVLAERSIADRTLDLGFSEVLSVPVKATAAGSIPAMVFQPTAAAYQPSHAWRPLFPGLRSRVFGCR